MAASIPRRDSARQVPRLMVSAPHRSSGKSTVAIGLCAALHARGLDVRPFKKGPDFIDPMWLTAAAGRECRNLDFHMMGEEGIRRSFGRHAPGADLCVVEGNHGLHDGLDPAGSDSSAALARLLGAPLLLVVDATGMNRSVAPLLKGHVGFEPDTTVAGIILNRVRSARHEKKLRAAVAAHVPVEVVGAIPRMPDLEIRERHLGLTPLAERPEQGELIERMAEAMRTYLDLSRIVGCARAAPPLDAGGEEIPPAPEGGEVTLGVARDEAFNFYYPENLEGLRRAGARLVFFSPLRDERLPVVDGLYLGGGFPEFFLDAIERNETLRREIARRAADGMPVWAECGGLMYLARSISWRGRRAATAGVIPGDIEMSDRPAAHGYVVLRESGAGPWPGKERELRGHEFHHSRITGLDGQPRFLFDVIRGRGIDGNSDGIMTGNCVAAYTHLHDAGAPFWAETFVSLVKGG